MNRIHLTIAATAAVLAGYFPATASVPFSLREDISSTTDFSRSVEGADLDGDGDIDVLSAASGDDLVVWFENLDGQGTFSGKMTISGTAEGANAAGAFDIDGDGDLDVVAAADVNDLFVWYENQTGAADFSTSKPIGMTGDAIFKFTAADIDGDNDLDIVGASSDNSNVKWFENTDGNGNFAPGTLIDGALGGANYVDAADFDGDGDVDVLATGFSDDEVVIYQNVNGDGSFWNPQVLNSTASGAWVARAGDIDGDGDMDVVSGSASDNRFQWYENLDGDGTFTGAITITTVTQFPQDLDFADIDNDGDLDLVTASFLDDRVAWFENLDGKGDFGPINTINFTGDGTQVTSVAAADLDGDGDPEVLSTSYSGGRVSFYENLSPILGGITLADLNSSDQVTTYTNSTTVKVTLSGVEDGPSDSLYVSEDNFATSTTVSCSSCSNALATITEQAEGQVTLYARLGTDSALSDITSATIVLDTSGPVTSVVSPTGVVNQKDPVIDVVWAGSDVFSELESVELFFSKSISKGVVFQSAGTYTSSPIPFDTAAHGGDGTYEFYTIGTDSAGNTEVVPPSPDVSVTYNNTTAVRSWALY
ncbi:MAG: VCBS repeat-containing protein [Sumerlaeia bacterium]